MGSGFGNVQFTSKILDTIKQKTCCLETNGGRRDVKNWEINRVYSAFHNNTNTHSLVANHISLSILHYTIQAILVKSNPSQSLS